MMNRKTISQIISLATSQGVVIRPKTQAAIAEFENPSPHHTIAVAGCFQVGKSTLLNRAMLGSEVLLSEGGGLPTTAIPTKITYGVRKELTVFFRNPSTPSRTYRETELTPELMRDLTTAVGEDPRVLLAQKIQYIQLTLPIESIKNFTFFDTPGVDDPNQALIELTTAEIILNADLVVLVVDASKALSEFDKRFLCKSIFKQGISRVLVLASYNPKRYKAMPEREMILNTIKAELTQIGRGYIPVHSYTYDASVEGDILCGAEEIMPCIMNFIEKNKEAAKVDKAGFYLQGDVVAHMEALKAKLEVSGKTDAQIKAIERKITGAAITLDAEYTGVVNDFTTGFNKALQSASKELDERLGLAGEPANDSALAQFMLKFEDCKDVAEVKSRVEMAVSDMTLVVQGVLANIRVSVEDACRTLLERSNERIAQVGNMIVISAEFEGAVNTGWFGKINPTLLKVLEVGLGFLMFNIMGLFVFFLDRIPVIRNLLPHVFIKNLVTSSLRDSFKDSLKVAKDDMLRQLDRVSDEIKNGIKGIFAEIYEDRITPYNDAMANFSGQSLPAEETIEIRNQLIILESAAKQLDQ